MSLNDPAIIYGFVTTLEIDNLGLCGGMLLLNAFARPLEFHCTLPIKASRTQEILYGKSLRPFLCGHLIAKALIEKTKTQANLLITDCRDTWTVGCEISQPTFFHRQPVMVDGELSQTSLIATAAMDSLVDETQHRETNPGEWEHSGSLDNQRRDNQLQDNQAPGNPTIVSIADNWRRMQSHGQDVLIASEKMGPSESKLQVWLDAYCAENELSEPFERIRQAIAEAHNIARGAA